MQASGVSEKRWFNDQELMYSILCSGIIITLIYWPLLNSIFCLMLFACWLMFSKKTFSFRSLRGKLIILFSMLYVLVLVGCLFSADLKEALFKLQQKPTYLIFPLVFGTTAVLTPRVMNTIINSFILATLSGCLFCIGHALYKYLFFHDPGFLVGYPVVTLKNMHPVVMGLCCILSIIFLLESWYLEKQEGQRVPYWKPIAALLLVGFIFLVGNRSNLVSVAGILIFYAFRMIPKWKHRVLFISSFVAVSLVIFFMNPVLQRQFYDIIDFSKEKSIQLDSNQPAAEIYGGKTLRLAIWRCATDVIEANWLTGVGTGDVYPALEDAYRKRQFNSALGHKEYNAHNQYLQETISYGLAGGLLLIALIIVPFTLPLREHVRTPYLLFIMCFAFVCLTECLLELNKGIIWYSFFNALLVFRNDAWGEDVNRLY